MNRVAIIDYGLCNLDSVRRALEELGASPVVVGAGADLGEPDHIVLPGVGAFPDAMAELHRRDLLAPLEEQVMGHGVPLLGICLGMQLLARSSTENGPAQGLGWIDAEVVRLVPDAPGIRIPHMGWNEVHPTGASELFEGSEADADFYFVHGYQLVARRPDDVLATTPYCGGFVSAVGRGTVFGVQFHPEKSQRAGFTLLSRFLGV